MINEIGLSVEAEAVLLRMYMAGAGSRAIACALGVKTSLINEYVEANSAALITAWKATKGLAGLSAPIAPLALPMPKKPPTTKDGTYRIFEVKPQFGTCILVGTTLEKRSAQERANEALGLGDVVRFVYDGGYLVSGIAGRLMNNDEWARAKATVQL
jgi:hypothetical protein